MQGGLQASLQPFGHPLNSLQFPALVMRPGLESKLGSLPCPAHRARDPVLRKPMARWMAVACRVRASAILYSGSSSTEASMLCSKHATHPKCLS